METFHIIPAAACAICSEHCTRVLRESGNKHPPKIHPAPTPLATTAFMNNAVTKPGECCFINNQSEPGAPNRWKVSRNSRADVSCRRCPAADPAGRVEKSGPLGPRPTRNRRPFGDRRSIRPRVGGGMIDRFHCQCRKINQLLAPVYDLFNRTLFGVSSKSKLSIFPINLGLLTL